MTLPPSPPELSALKEAAERAMRVHSDDPNYSPHRRDFWNLAQPRAILSLLHSLATLTAENQQLREAASNLIEGKGRTYKARNGRVMSIEADDGEACDIIHSDLTEALRSALQPNTGETK